MPTRVPRRPGILHLVRGLCLLAFLLSLVRPSPGQEPDDTNYDESLVPAYRLPDPLTCFDGRVVTSPAEWLARRRPEILQAFAEQVYGRTPRTSTALRLEVIAEDPGVFRGIATRKEIRIRLFDSERSPWIDLLLYLPNAARQPCPVFLGLNYGNQGIVDDPQVTPSRHSVAKRGEHAHRWPLELLLKRGYAVATFHGGDVELDRHGSGCHFSLDAWKTGVRHYLLREAGREEPGDDEWGAIGVWAWGLSRALDCLSSEPRIDATRVAVLGHSRTAKAALWAGAQDERFALVIANNSGQGGAALARRRFGETVRASCELSGSWYCGNYQQYKDNEANLPVDAHLLVAAIAPRPVYIASAEQDRWADPRGEFLAAMHAEPVYQLLGRPGLGSTETPPLNTPIGTFTGYHLRGGDHEITQYDWLRYLDFADRHLRNRRVLYNFDGDSCLTTKANSRGPVPVDEADVRRLIAEVAYPGSRVDTVLVCVNAQVMYYPTQAGTMRGSLSTPAERAAWPASERQRFANLSAFFDAGVDPYAIMLSEARQRGRETLLSFRMNDDHGNDFLRTQFLADHPEWRLGTEQFQGSGAMDFAREEVRDYTFRLIEEAVNRYECDGLELDFNRFPRFFRDGAEDHRLEKMNELVSRVRRMLDDVGLRRGKRLVLGVRVPSNFGRTPPTPESARQVGCDVVCWARSGWLDYVAVSEFLFERDDLPIRAWKEAIPSVPIYGGVECTRGGGQKNLTHEEYRQAAAHRMDNRADGVYLFNFFTSREEGPSAYEPPFEALGDLGLPKIGLRRQLFVDDYFIAQQQGLHRQLGQVTKANQGRPIFTDGWFYGTVLHDQERFKLWYRKPGQQGYGYAESLDGQSFRHIASLEGISFAGDYTLAVEIDSSETDAGHRYKAGYDAIGMAAGIAHSANGIHWTPYHQGKPVTKRAADTYNQIIWDPEANTYRLFTRSDFGAPGGLSELRGTRSMTNPAAKSNPADWKTVREWIFDREGPGEALRRQVYAATCWIHEGIYFALLTVYEYPGDTSEGQSTDHHHRHERDVMNFYIATSRDGDSWDLQWVYAGQPLIPRGPEGAFDKDLILPASTIVTHDDRHWLYYSGANERHGTPDVHFERTHAIGLAHLRLDGFVGLRAGSVEGTITTKPFRLEANRFHVNVDAAEGECAVELLDESGQPLTGFPSASANFARGVNDLRWQPTWRDTPDLSKFLGKTVRLRIRLRDATLYSVQAVHEQPR